MNKFRSLTLKGQGYVVLASWIICVIILLIIGCAINESVNAVLSILWLVETILAIILSISLSKNKKAVKAHLSQMEEAKKEEDQKARINSYLEKAVAKTEARKKVLEANPQELERLTKMCQSIINEIDDQYKKYSSTSDFIAKADVLKEINRKLCVLESTLEAWNFLDYNLFETREKLEAKAKSLVNSYIKDEREQGFENDSIYLDEFTQPLDFIYDYIEQKQDKLNGGE